MTRTCSFCGAVAEVPDDGMPAGWSFAVERARAGPAPEAIGRVTWLCVDCARVNIRAIEGKLSEEYWQ